jgi:hypothetical protein
LRSSRLVAWWNRDLPRLVLSPEAPIHARIEALEQFNRNIRLLMLDQAWWRANPLGMLWREMDAAFVTSGSGNGGCQPRRSGRRHHRCR